jgi:hypothetical protein
LPHPFALFAKGWESTNLNPPFSTPHKIPFFQKQWKTRPIHPALRRYHQ